MTDTPQTTPAADDGAAEQDKLDSFLQTLKVHNKDLGVCFNDAVAVSHLSALIRAEADRLARERMEAVRGKLPEKKYSGNHDSSHTWITNGYCHACKEPLTIGQLEEEFGWNVALVAVDSVIAGEVKRLKGEDV